MRFWLMFALYDCPFSPDVHSRLRHLISSPRPSPSYPGAGNSNVSLVLLYLLYQTRVIFALQHPSSYAGPGFLCPPSPDSGSSLQRSRWRVHSVPQLVDMTFHARFYMQDPNCLSWEPLVRRSTLESGYLQVVTTLHQIVHTRQL